METILVVDDERSMRDLLANIIGQEDRTIVFASGGKEALQELGRNKIDLILTDIRMPDMDGFELIRKTHETYPDLPIITLTAYASTETAVQALRAGAYDYVVKPFPIEELQKIVDHALRAQRLFQEVNYLRGRLAQRYSLDSIIGQSEPMQKVFETILHVAPAPCNVLITGESGTGKELVAQAIHHHSLRSEAKFVPINCSSIPEGLLESELFGHVKGAFTGAVSHKIGLVQAADGGTLFLDEIGDMPLALQAKLLRLLQNHRVQKVGSTEFETVDTRILAATNQNLTEKIKQKQFRSDLFYRLDVVEINLPPLRERSGDISILASHFLKHHSKSLGREIKELSPSVKKAFQLYPWPGNVRELENAIERAVTLCDGDIIELGDMPYNISDYTSREEAKNGSLQELLSLYERHCIRSALEATNYNISEAAENLGISPATLYRKLKKLGLHVGIGIVEARGGKVETAEYQEAHSHHQ